MSNIGQCLLSVIPVRSEGRSQSEIVTQLLYGETYQVLSIQEDWVKISIDFDHYEGYISVNQHSELSFKANSVVSDNLFEKMGGLIVPFGGETQSNKEQTSKSVIQLAELFNGCPYLWGGKTFMGIDCSGLMQVIHKAVGIRLPRDASQQALVGKQIEYGERLPGDLAFFRNTSGKIHHVGLLVDPDHIIHASGCVRIDDFGSTGISRSDTRILSHSFGHIRRLI